MPSIVTETKNGDHAEHVRQSLAKSGLDKHFKVYLPKDNQLLIDIDSPNLPPQFFKARDMMSSFVKEFFPDEKWSYEVSQSKSMNLHVIVTVPFILGEHERVAWQAIFGSDLVRDSLILRSLWCNENHPNLLIEMKDRGGVIERWES